jgi:hypothetical protein
MGKGQKRIKKLHNAIPAFFHFEVRVIPCYLRKHCSCSDINTLDKSLKTSTPFSTLSPIIMGQLIFIFAFIKGLANINFKALSNVLANAINDHI